MMFKIYALKCQKITVVTYVVELRLHHPESTSSLVKVTMRLNLVAYGKKSAEKTEHEHRMNTRDFSSLLPVTLHPCK